jgi:2-phospho-L-lactate/phosphoenolpyruvate guanylyltransferase
MIAAIIPVKPLQLAKGRLAPVLSAPERRELVLAMLGDLLAALRATEAVSGAVVVSRDAEVLAWAARLGARALRERAPGLNDALAQAAAFAEERRAAALLALPADLPLVTPTEIGGLIEAGAGAASVVLAPSRDGGTNGLYLRAPRALPFLFGPDSLARHVQAARERGIVPRLFRAPGLELDVDRPDDLLLLTRAAGATAAQRLVRDLNLCERMACV